MSANKNFDNKWDGEDKDGKKLSQATYYYVVQYQDTPFSEFVKYTGFVELKY